MRNRSCLLTAGTARALVCLAVVTAVGLGLPLTAGAQVEEIVVTARKKEESLQDVPLSIAAFSSEQLQRRGIQSNYDVAAFTPNFKLKPELCDASLFPYSNIS